MTSIYCNLLDGECFDMCDYCPHGYSKRTIDDYVKVNTENVSHETIETYVRCDDIGETHHIWYTNDGEFTVVMESTKRVCNWYEPFESVCLSECTWCDNPYHCHIKCVSRETITTSDLLNIIFSDTTKINISRLSYLQMINLSTDMILRGDY